MPPFLFSQSQVTFIVSDCCLTTFLKLISRDSWEPLFDVMRKPLDFEAAFVLTADNDGLFKTQATSDALFREMVWEPHSMFRRVIEGEPAAVFDTELVSEWRSQPKRIRDSVKSALHFSIRSSEKKALFICTHSSRGHFSRDHLTIAHRFSMLAIQALEKIEAEIAAILEIAMQEGQP